MTSLRVACSGWLEPKFISWRVWDSFLKSPPPLPWAMFSKVDSLRRSKQEWMPRLDCEERQINETAHQLMRSSFVKIVLCGQFCFGDLKSVFGCGVGGLLISSGSLGAWSMSHRKMVVLCGVCLPVCLSDRERNTWRNESKPQYSRWLGSAKMVGVEGIKQTWLVRCQTYLATILVHDI